jgi:hypothetical protein
MKSLLNWVNRAIYTLGNNHYWFRAMWTMGRFAFNWLLAPFRVLLYVAIDLIGSMLLTLLGAKEYFLTTTYSWSGLVEKLREMKVSKE